MMPNNSNPDNDIVVGFKKEETTIVEHLIRGSNEREVILITGMGGLGKTTLARRVYKKKDVVNHFDKRVWCTVSQEYDYKGLLNKIYNYVCCKEAETEIDSVAEKLRKSLMGWRYLIVLDDIWSLEAWEELNRVFPLCDKGSRIVLTSREKSVVSNAKHICHLPFFTTDESWELLQVKLFKRKGCPKGLEDVGREISKKCKGLPFTVGLIAGLLEKVKKSEQMWHEFLLTLNSHVTFGDGIQSNDAIELSYKYLSDHLKPCLLYFATFLEDEKIEVSKLIKLWISEGFIVGMTEKVRVEDEAEDYLNHLVRSNLIMVSSKNYDGRIVSCMVHDLVRDFCLKKAREEISLEIINNMEKKWDPTLNFSRHRICLHCQGIPHLSSELVPWNSSIHTILVFCRYNDGHLYNGSWIDKRFEHLTILDLDCILVHRSIFSEVNSLIHLRYLALNVDGDKDDVSTLSLENLEHLITLKLHSEKVHFPFIFWNMKRLRHMSISGVCCDESCMEKSRSIMIEAIPACSKELQTWCWRCPLTPNHERLLRELPCLRTLICDVSSSESFPKIDVLHHLEKLELYCGNGSPHLFNDLKLNKFPSSVKEIHLTRITLSVSAISTIAQNPNLENLVLRGCMFEEGLTWNVGEETKFQKLKRLQLSWDYTEIWNISSAAESFPCLEQLDLIYCSDLRVMPSGFEDVLTLKMIYMCYCNSIVYNWVKEIEECARELGNEQLHVYIDDLSMFGQL